MKKIKMLILVFYIVLLNGSLGICNGNKKEVDSEEINKIVKQLNSDNWGKRRVAFHDIQYMDFENKEIKVKNKYKTKEINDAVFNMFKEYKKLPQNQKRKYGGHENTLYRDLVGALGEDFKDKRIIPYIVPIDSTYAVSALVSIGEPAVKPLIKTLNHKNWAVRQSAALVLSRIIEKEDIPDKTRNKVKEKLLKALKEKKNKHPDKNIEYFEFRASEKAAVRKSIIEALGNFDDPEVIKQINHAAKNDPYYKTKNGKKEFIVKEKAKETLEKIKRKKKEKEQNKKTKEEKDKNPIKEK